MFMENKNNNEELKKVIELMIIRMNEKGELDLIYSDYLVHLMNENSIDQVKKAFLDSVSTVIDNISKDLTAIKNSNK